jgi:hypothetical protein
MVEEPRIKCKLMHHWCNTGAKRDLLDSGRHMGMGVYSYLLIFILLWGSDASDIASGDCPYVRISKYQNNWIQARGSVWLDGDCKFDNAQQWSFQHFLILLVGFLHWRTSLWPGIFALNSSPTCTDSTYSMLSFSLNVIWNWFEGTSDQALKSFLQSQRCNTPLF